MNYLKAITATDVLLLAGFVAVCAGCALVATWLALVVGGVMVIGYALYLAKAKAWLNLKRRNRDVT